ncbi:MAG: hypothetical protein NXY57DRAFT_96580 [Lentinula lateritia]|nr:MAG: hypothetical protein NXY57DRAFT_96580 [Lentinula lateritia]
MCYLLLPMTTILNISLSLSWDQSVSVLLSRSALSLCLSCSTSLLRLVTPPLPLCDSYPTVVRDHHFFHLCFVLVSVSLRCHSLAYSDFPPPASCLVATDDLAGYDAISGVEFQQWCQYSNSVWIFDNLPFVWSSLETRLPLPVLPLVTGQYPSVFPCSQDSEPLSLTPNFIPQIGFVMNKLVSPPAVTSCVSNSPINDSEQSQCALHVGSSFVSNNKITKNLVSPNGCSRHNGTHPLINRENHTVAFVASTSQCHSVPSISPTSNDILTACLFVMRLYTD